MHFTPLATLFLSVPLAAALPSLSARFLTHQSKHKVGIESGHVIQRAASNSSTLKPKHFQWAPPGEHDVRAPCPMLNTLANHDFLPHSGKNITQERFVQALKDGFNANEVFSTEIFQTAALPFFPIDMGSPTTFDLDMLHVHNVIEHDGSLSRRDHYFDKSNLFDEDTFQNLLSYFGDAQEMTVEATANARARHAADMAAENPLFAILPAQQGAILGENALMLTVWGSPERPVANRSFYEFFFRNQRFPVKLGWSPSQSEVGLEGDLGALLDQLTLAKPADVPFTWNKFDKHLEDW